MATVRKNRGHWVADFRDQNGRRRIEAPKGPFETTFAGLAKAWLDSKVKLRATSVSDYQIMLDSYLLPYFGARKIETMSRQDIERFRTEMTNGVPETVRLAREAKLKALHGEAACTIASAGSWLAHGEQVPRRAGLGVQLRAEAQHAVAQPGGAD
jgi:hypothetical protein